MTLLSHRVSEAPGEKASRVVNGCISDPRGVMGVMVVCWGCNVWHRWSKDFPVLHIQGPTFRNNVVWVGRSR